MQSGYVDISALQLEERDTVIFRSDEPETQRRITQVEATLRRANPHWKGVLLGLGLAESFETLGQDVSLELYQTYKRIFEDWEKWASEFEISERKCVRCGQAHKSGRRYEEVKRLEKRLVEVKLERDAAQKSVEYAQKLHKDLANRYQELLKEVNKQAT